ncbi:breast carcinoma-amplified sequence 1 [Acridotheres tristis]
MGNTPSVPEEAEDDNTCTVKSYQPLPQSPDSVQNGSVVFAGSLALNGGEDAQAAPARDNAAVSPEPSHGSAARRALPAASPRSLLAVPGAVPGRAEGPAASPAPGEPAPGALGLRRAPAGGTEGQKSPLQDTQLTGTPQGRHVATPKDKPVTFLDRIFRLEKGKGGTRGDPEEGRQGLDAPNGVLLGKVEQESPQAAAGQGSVMSFLKTLVSPSKAEAKSDSEDKGSKVEKGPGGQPGPKAAAESPPKGGKKKKAERPRLGHGTFSKLFRHKAAKETQQTTNTKSPEQPAVTCVKADRNVPPSQEPPAKQNPKMPETTAPVQAVATETPREATKDKGSATPLPLSKLFWKKNSSEEAEAVSNEKAEVALEAVAPDRDESKSAESTEVKPRGAESKTPKANLRKLFKLSVKGAGGTPSSEEGDAPSPRHHHTLNPTEKPPAPSDSDPGGQRSKEGSKDKKSTLELGKQKGKEQPEPREGPAGDPDSIQNGGDTKEPPYKKAEKRQSLGGFFKGLGSKRMSDAEVQTDPVSILPAGKSK